ncbi:MAG: FKBP-type peptidyl-prolyl cis-trans isomerase [Prevotella sp.]|nr:FKBP-type peptidyl-prolyl cis-trans isomerase [Prevotella sp.]
MKESRKRWKLWASLTCLVALLALSSCKESDDSVDEFANWQETNENYFNNLYSQVTQKIAAGDTDWMILRKWSLEESIATRPENHIIVHVLEKGSGSGCPMFTDSVRVHYSGKLLPSASFPSGYTFDKSYYDTFDPATSRPSTMCCSNLTDGFATAVMNMHIGDMWEIYVPHQLAYGKTGTTNSSGTQEIPGYSTLIFNVTLVSYYRTGATPPPFQAKKNGGWIE